MERERGANASKSEEQDPDAAITEPVEPETKSNPANKPQTVEGQYFAAAPPEIFGIKSWSDFMGPGPIQSFWESAIKKANELPERPADAEIVAQTMIRNHGHLMWPKYQAAELKRQAAEAAAQTIAAQPSEPREPLDSAIARLMAEHNFDPVEVLAKVRPLNGVIFASLPFDPEEAWKKLSHPQKSIIRTYLESHVQN